MTLNIEQKAATKRRLVPREVRKTPEESDLGATYDSEYDSSTSSSTSSPVLPQSFSDDSQLVEGSSQFYAKLHPSKPDTLHVGYSEQNGTDIWLRFTSEPGLRGRDQKSVLIFFDHRSQRCSEESLHILWHKDFRYENFTTLDGDKIAQKRSQRRYIYEILRKTQRYQRRNPQDNVIHRAKPGTLTPTMTSRQKCKRKVSPAIERSSLRISNKRHRRSEPKNYHESDVELLSGEEDNPRRRRGTKTADRSARTANTIPKGGPSDDLEIILAPIVKPSSIRPQYDRPQEIQPNVESEFSSDAAQRTAIHLPSNVVNATSLLVSLSNQPDRAPANGK